MREMPDQYYEKQKHPTLSNEDNKTERGDTPLNAQSQISLPKGMGKVDPQTRQQVETFIKDQLAKRKTLLRDLIWPYLLIRAQAGDHGVRQPPLGCFWESPDIRIVQGDVASLQGQTPTLSPAAGVDHSIFIHVWNLGRLSALSVSLRVYWASPAFSFEDPTHLPQYIGGMYLNLPSMYQPDCHQLFRVPSLWRPTVENDGHECLLAKVESYIDPARSSFDASTDRHVGQRNITLSSPGNDLSPLITKLGSALPKNADLHLIDGMGSVTPILSVNQPDLAKKLSAPTHKPIKSTSTSLGTAHLGAIVNSKTKGMFFVPGDVMASKTSYDPEKVVEQPRAKNIEQKDAPSAILESLGITDFKADSIASELGAATDEAHILRFQAVQNGVVMGGYSIIVYK
jgi:hypothetical protein